MENNSLKALYIIVNAGFAEEAVQITRKCGAGGATVINARGTGSTLNPGAAFHFEPEKEVIISIVSEEVAIAIMKEIKTTSGTDTPANGICYCMSADRVSFINKMEVNLDEASEPSVEETKKSIKNQTKADKKALSAAKKIAKMELKEKQKAAKQTK